VIDCGSKLDKMMHLLVHQTIHPSVVGDLVTASAGDKSARPRDGHVRLMQPEEQTTTRGSLEVSAAA
jgi:hypothetical protein